MNEHQDGVSTNDPNSAHATPTSHSDLDAYYANYNRVCAEASVENKEILFSGLAAAGITVVIVTFDGGSDEGQIESIEARRADEVAEFPDQQIEFQHPVMEVLGQIKITTVSHGFAEAVTRLAYDFLGRVQDGWENGEGAYGDFTFDVGEKSITLDFNERFIDSENSSYQF